MKKEQYTEKADVFSYGIIMWELVVRKKPFSEYDIANSEFTYQLEDAIVGGLRPSVPVDCPSGYAELMQACWDGDPKRRPQFEEIIRRLRKINSALHSARSRAFTVAN
jgi:serine/threonine protein kinase